MAGLIVRETISSDTHAITHRATRARMQPVPFASPFARIFVFILPDGLGLSDWRPPDCRMIARGDGMSLEIP